MPKTRRAQDPRQKNQVMEISFMDQPVMEEFVWAVGHGSDVQGGNEIAAYGTRGDGKTIGWMIST